MPYLSERQRAYFHAQKGKKISAQLVDEFDRETGDAALPERVEPRPKRPRATTRGRKRTQGSLTLARARTVGKARKISAGSTQRGVRSRRG